MYFGSKLGKEQSFRILDLYVEYGGSFLDTSNNYARWVPGCSGGESETVLGEWLSRRGNRSQMFIATKVGFQMPGVERGLSADQIRTECEKSLKRLGVDTIDLYYAHVDDRHIPLEETMYAFHKLIEEGKVRYIGASNYAAWRLEEARNVSMSNGWTPFCAVQQRHSFARPRPGASFDPQVAATEELLDYCRNRRMALLAYSPLLAGAYSQPDRSFPDQYAGSHDDYRLKALREMAQHKGTTVNQLILAWLLHSDPAVLPLVAVSSGEQLSENVKSLDVRLGKEEMEQLKDCV